jgi:hypothetical protein
MSKRIHEERDQQILLRLSGSEMARLARIALSFGVNRQQAIRMLLARGVAIMEASMRLPEALDAPKKQARKKSA